jgi:hypothetical protein
MLKTLNSFGHSALSADKGKTLYNGEIYTKIYISNKDIDETAWTEVDDSEVPVMDEEPTAEGYEAALAEMGVEV